MTSVNSIFKQSQDKIEQLKKDAEKPVGVMKQNLIFYGGVFFLMIFVMLFAAKIIQGMLALMLLVVVLPTAFYLVKMVKASDPLIRQKLKNEILKRQIDEATENAIYQLKNAVIDQGKELDQSRTQRNKVKAKLKQLEDQVSEMKETRGEDSSAYKSTYDILLVVRKSCKNVEKLVDLKGKKFKKFKEQVEESEEKWKISLLAKDVISLTGSIEDNLTDILNQTAFDAIDTEFNNDIAQLEGSVSDIDFND